MSPSTSRGLVSADLLPRDPVTVLWYLVLLGMLVAWVVSRRRLGASTAVHDLHAPPSNRALAHVFDPRANGLNAIRLCLASMVIVWHSFPLTGRTLSDGPLRQALGQIPVDGFFAISGFLIAGSWVRRPHAAAFVKSRVLRIYPGFLVCLVVTAALLAPLGIALGPERLSLEYWKDAPAYVVNNMTLRIVHYDIAGTPAGVPRPGAWNGSLWTLRWEFMCYGGVLLLGLVGLLRRISPSILLFVGATLLSIATTYASVERFDAESFARFGTTFLAGVVVYVARRHIPVNGWLVAGSGAVVIAALTMPNYRVVGALFLAYFLVAMSTYLRWPSVQLRNDLSYGVYIYAFPVQQILAGTSAVDLPVAVFMALSLLATLPLAAASWFLVERRAVRSGRSARSPVPA